MTRRKTRNSQVCQGREDISGGLSSGDICLIWKKSDRRGLFGIGENWFQICFGFLLIVAFVILVWTVCFLIRMRET